MTEAKPRREITPRYLSPQELATWLAQKQRTIRHWRETEYGPKPSKFGRSVRYAVKEVEAFCADPEGYQYRRSMEVDI
jgi:hypothetical protein